MTNTSRMSHVALVLIIAVCFWITGCSSGSPVNPDGEVSIDPLVGQTSQNTSNRALWGLWDIGYQKSSGKLEIVPVRGLDFHLNAVKFLEPPPLTNLTFDSGTLIADPGGNYIAVDIILSHPFPGMNQFSGFDVRGIVLLPGSAMPYNDPSIICSGAGEPRVINADGWSRWWNPKEFPSTGIFGFQEGMIGAKGGAGFFTSTLNGYKYFADGLGINDPLTTLTKSGRGVFAAGNSNRRHYEISFGENPSDWLRFQYAVDACWSKPATLDNPQVPEDFPSEANAPEGYYVKVVENENTLWWLEAIGMGGHLDLSVDVYTWRPEAIERVKFVGPGLLASPVEMDVVSGSGGGPDDPVYSTYTIDIVPDALTSTDTKDCLIIVETEESYSQVGQTVFFGPVGTKVSGYCRYPVEISYTPPLQWKLVRSVLLPTQPGTVLADMSVVGRESNKGVYFFGDEYKMYRYDLEYNEAVHATSLAGFFGYSALDLYGAPETLGRFELCPFGQFVASSISAAPSPTFLGGLKRDYAFFFSEFYSQGGQIPMQIGIPDPSKGYFRFVDASANWAEDVEDAKIYWIQVDDPDEPTEPDPEITVILGVYQHEFSGNPFTDDVTFITGSVAPAGHGNGLVDTDAIDRFAVDGDPQGVTGSIDLVCWFMETDPPALECFGVVSSDETGDLNVPLTTINNFHATPRDIAVMPSYKGGYGAYNWVVALEEGDGEWSIESFDQTGESWVSILDVPGYPACIDIDPVRYQLHVWFTVMPGGPIHAAIFDLELG